jgi:MYXO-CTERM domain-containing protein
MLVTTTLLALFADPGVAAHPYGPSGDGPKTVDLRTHRATTRATAEGPRFDELDEHIAAPQPVPTESREGTLPAGWVQQGNVVMPAEVADGSLVIEPETIFAVEDIPGNKYPRKHTLYMNFSGGELISGSDNSAENKSTLAQMGMYPVYTGGEQKAVAAAQGVQTDVANFGIRVVYLERPPKILPYTMAMIGGSWQDTNLEEPAGGVAPGADCGALGQRHVVYVFADGGWGSVGIANVTSQEAGHAWGLDHNLNCGSVMSYCGGGDGVFSGSCDGLCEAQCQGDAGCRLTHEMFCGEGNDQQNEQEELGWIFGGNEPDVEPPSGEIVEPADGAEFEAGASVDLRAIVDDNYGGFGWSFRIEKDGEVAYDEVDYEREVDAEYRAALNLVNLEPGAYTATVTVMDHGDMTSSHTVSFTVLPGAGDDGDGDGGVDGTGGGSDGGSADDAGDETGGADDDDDDDDGDDADDGSGGEAGLDGGTAKDDGCSCRASASPSGALAFLLAAFVGVRRRRPA